MAKTKAENQAKYAKNNTITKTIQLNKETDKDILEYLEDVTNFQGYIKRLIRNDMKKEEVKNMYKNIEYKVYFTETNQYGETRELEMNVYAPNEEEAKEKVLKNAPNATITKTIEASKLKHFRVHVIDYKEHWYDTFAETKEEIEQYYSNDPMVKEFEVYE